MANVGITLIWQKAIAALCHETTMHYLRKLGEWTKNFQATKLKSPQNKVCIRYLDQRDIYHLLTGEIIASDQSKFSLSISSGFIANIHCKMPPINILLVKYLNKVYPSTPLINCTIRYLNIFLTTRLYVKCTLVKLVSIRICT